MVYSRRVKTIVLAVCCMSVLISPMTGSMVNLALKYIGADLGVGTHDLGMVSTAFFLASVLAMVPLAKAADIYGKKRIMLAGLVLMAAGSLLNGLAPNYASLVACRVITGIGSAAITCTGLSLLSDVFEPHQRGRVFGINTAFVYLGLSIGPFVGGAVVDALGWRSVFFIMVPISLITLIPLLAVKEDFRPQAGGRIDVRGAVLYMASMALTLYGLTLIPDPWCVPCIAAGLVLLVVFGKAMAATRDPLLNVGIFRSTVVTRSMVAMLLNYASSFAVAFFCALYLQSVCGFSATMAGLMLMVQTVIQCILSPTFGRLSDSMDPRVLPTAGMFITSAGLAMVAMFGVGTETAFIVAAFAVLGIGFAVFSSPNTNVVMSSVRREDYSAASAMVAVFRQTGTVASMALAMACVALIMGSLDVLDETTIPSFILTMRTAFTVCVAMCLAGAVISWFRGTGAPDAE